MAAANAGGEPLMRAPGFWWRNRPNAAALALSPIGAVYGAITAYRMAQEGVRCGVPVICVGNFVAGGAGKTPTAIAVAQLLIGMGRSPAFLSRGYGRENNLARRVDPQRDLAQDVGDEPLLLAKIAPTIIAQDRVSGAQLCEETGADVIIMDDGLQNPSLHKDLRIAVVDGGVGTGNGLCIPAGPLRASLERQLAHVDAILIIGEGEAGERVAQQAQKAGKSLLRATLAPEPGMAMGLRDRDVLAFAGIGRPDKFFETLRALGAQLVETESFPDHHAFTAREIAGLQSRARRLGAALVTTEKDAVRLGAAADELLVLPVTLKLQDETGLAHLLAHLLAKFRASP
jgi:tetraacyldisaccharide 4'-kinase